MQDTQCPLSVNDSETLQGPSKLFFVEEDVCVMTSLHVITDVQMCGLIQPHKWKRPILDQFHEGYIIHVWQFRYRQERRQWE